MSETKTDRQRRGRQFQQQAEGGNPRARSRGDGDRDDVERVEGLVSQVIAPDQRGGYAVPSDILDGLEDDQDLCVLQRDPYPRPIRQVLNIPVLGVMLDIPLAFVDGILSAAPVSNPVDCDVVTLAVEQGTIDEGDRVDVAISEAVVDETRIRDDVVDREVGLWDVVDLREVRS